MSDILSNFLSPKSVSRKNKFSKDFLNKSDRIFLNNGLRLSKDTNIIKLPKLKFYTGNITENNNSKENNYAKIITINKLNEKKIQLNLDPYQINEDNYNIIFENRHSNKLNNHNINQSSKNKNQILYKYNRISDDDCNIINKSRDNIQLNNNKKMKKERTMLIDKYVDDLLKNGKKKFDKFDNAKKKAENNKYLLENCINPAKYFEKNIFDDNFDYNSFKTSNIQKDCFNGNEKFRKANLKNIRINLMNNIFLNNMQAESEDNGMKFTIKKMIDEQKHINKFSFGMHQYNQKEE